MKIFKRYFALLCIVLLLISISGEFVSAEISTPEKPLSPQLLYLSLGPDPTSLDPSFYGGALTDGYEGGHIINNTFEGLLRQINGKLEPAIAEKYEVSDDKMTYIFTLRDTKWSDGQSVKAQDFEYAWKRSLDPTTASDYAYLLYVLQGGLEYNEGTGKSEDVGVQALGDKTLKVTLTSPMPHFLHMTTLHNFMPLRKDMVEADPENWSKNPKLTVSNGPFKITEYIEGNKIILDRNEDYWNINNIRLDRIIASIRPEVSLELEDYKANNVYMVDTISHQDLASLKEQSLNVTLLPEHMVYYYIFNTSKPPLNNINVRKALSLAIDRNLIVIKAAKPGQNPASGIIPKGFKDSENHDFRMTAGNYGLTDNPNQIKEAQRLLAEAGYPEGKGLEPVEILFNLKPESEKHEEIAKAIQEMWKQNLGIEVHLQGKEFSEFREAMKQDNFMIARSGWGADYGDAMTFLEGWTTEGYGSYQTKWQSAEYDKLIAVSHLSSGKERDELLYQAEKLFMEDMPILPIYYLTDPVLVKDYIKGWEKTILSYWWFGNTTIEPVFKDMSSNHFAYKASKELLKQEILDLSKSDKFGPEEFISKQDAEEWLKRALPSKDISSAIAQIGSADSFTREEIASLLVKVFDLKPNESVKVKLKDLNKISSAHLESVKVLYQTGITVGSSDDSYAPQSKVTRAQFITFLYCGINL